VLLASGFEHHEVDQVKAALPSAREVRQKRTWALLVISPAVQLICGADLQSAADFQSACRHC
jgi:hypothetical protein